jgi:hypothetical protein
MTTHPVIYDYIMKNVNEVRPVTARELGPKSKVDQA